MKQNASTNKMSISSNFIAIGVAFLALAAASSFALCVKYFEIDTLSNSIADVLAVALALFFLVISQIRNKKLNELLLMALGVVFVSAIIGAYISGDASLMNVLKRWWNYLQTARRFGKSLWSEIDFIVLPLSGMASVWW